MSNTIILFDEKNGPDAPFSQRYFTVQGQTTIVGVGLQDDDEITFEILRFDHTVNLGDDCFCLPNHPQLPPLMGVQPLMCPACQDCESDRDDTQLVRLTARNPVVILDYPAGPLLRARYTGTGLGSAMVWLWQDGLKKLGSLEDYATKDLTPELRGCPPKCCEVTEWRPTGDHMCDADLDAYMREEISNCCTYRWVVEAPILWVDTGDERCYDMTLEDDGGTAVVQFTKQVKQTNQCHAVRWIDLDGQVFKADFTGNVACGPEDSDTYTVRAEFRDSCGNTEWFELDNAQLLQLTGMEANWTDTGQTKCTGFSQTQDAATFTRIKEQVNLCGRSRWINHLTDSADTPPVAEPAQPTGEIECVNPSPDCEWPDSYLVRVQFKDACGNVISFQYDFADASQYATGQAWCETGNVACDNFREEGGELVYDVYDEQVNQCGNTRRVQRDTPVAMRSTGIFKTDPANPAALLEKFVSICGDVRWATSEDEQEWVPTGEERCVEGIVQLKEQTQGGHVRWFETERQCVSPEYIPTYNLPCGGLAFRPTDPIDPEATVLLGGCEAGDDPIAYLYPEPREGATTPVEGCGCDADLIGYAADGGTVSPDCHTPERIDIRKLPRTVVQVVTEGCSVPKAVWSDGTVTNIDLGCETEPGPGPAPDDTDWCQLLASREGIETYEYDEGEIAYGLQLMHSYDQNHWETMFIGPESMTWEVTLWMIPASESPIGEPEFFVRTSVENGSSVVESCEGSVIIIYEGKPLPLVGGKTLDGQDIDLAKIDCVYAGLRAYYAGPN